MPIRVIKGDIARRVLVNFRVDAEVLQRQLPYPFRVRQRSGYGIAGVCLIRLAGLRPALLPPLLGHSCENAAHRVAVEWDLPQGPGQGVFVFRRDTSSLANTWVGGRWFPGRQEHARFDVRDEDDEISVSARGPGVELTLEARTAARFPEDSVFASLQDASAFFERDSMSYSPTADPTRFDCVELHTLRWSVQPLAVQDIESSWLSDPSRFPPGSIELDSALLMRDVPHEWRAHPPLLVSRARYRSGLSRFATNLLTSRRSY